jgi:hypothetical protein
MKMYLKTFAFAFAVFAMFASHYFGFQELEAVLLTSLPILGYIAIPGTSGSSFFGGPNLRLGPCNVYYRTKAQDNLSGTISTIGTAITGTVALDPVLGRGKSTVTGTGTSFTADVSVGQYVKIDTVVAKIKRIISNTVLEVVEEFDAVAAGEDLLPYTTTVTGTSTAFDDELVVGDYIATTVSGTVYMAKVLEIVSATEVTIDAGTLVAGATEDYRKFTAIFLGGVDAVTIKESVKKADLKYSQYGDSAADKAVTGGEVTIEMGLAQASLERQEATKQGFEIQRDDEGLITGFGFGVAIGELDSEVEDQLTCVRIVGDVESTDPFDTIHFPRSVPMVDAESKYDSSSQRYMKTMFTCYRSEDHKLNGKSLFYFPEGMF